MYFFLFPKRDQEHKLLAWYLAGGSRAADGATPTTGKKPRIRAGQLARRAAVSGERPGRRR